MNRQSGSKSRVRRCAYAGAMERTTRKTNAAPLRKVLIMLSLPMPTITYVCTSRRSGDGSHGSACGKRMGAHDRGDGEVIGRIPAAVRRPDDAGGEHLK